MMLTRSLVVVGMVARSKAVTPFTMALMHRFLSLDNKTTRAVRKNHLEK